MSDYVLEYTGKEVENRLRMVGDHAENIVNLQGRMITAENDIDNIEGDLSRFHSDHNTHVEENAREHAELKGNISGLTARINATDGNVSQLQSNVSRIESAVDNQGYQIDNANQRISEIVMAKGATGGYAELDDTGKVPAYQLPSYVDDVLNGYFDKENPYEFYKSYSEEYDVYSDPYEPEDGKAYIDVLRNVSYRWTGTLYTQLNGGLALGETSETAFRGDWGKMAYDHAQTADDKYLRLSGGTMTGDLNVLPPTQNAHAATKQYVDETVKAGTGGDISADSVKFSDGQTFQQKYNSGELTGPQGPAGKDGATGPQGPSGVSNLESSGVTGILPITKGGTGNSTGYITTGQKAGTTLGERVTAEGSETTAFGNDSHAEGWNTKALNSNAHAEGCHSSTGGPDATRPANTTTSTADGFTAHAEGYATFAQGAFSHSEGYRTQANGMKSHAEGNGTTASGANSHAEGSATVASGSHSHAEGIYCCAGDADKSSQTLGAFTVGDYTHAEGFATLAKGSVSHSEGYKTEANGSVSHAEGQSTISSGSSSHAEGVFTEASGKYSHAGGYHTLASAQSQTAIGEYNVEYTSQTDALFIIGNGTSSARSNAFRITSAGKPYAKSTLATSGADYAEMFEWQDGNPNDEDRVGRFVVLDGEEIRLAALGDDDILGVVSGRPSVAGDVYADTWQGMHLRDIYGRDIWEEITVTDEAIRDEDDTTPKEYKQKVLKLNPDYDPSEPYISREDRPEWDHVGLLGKLVMLDDGTCEVNGYAMSSENGVATKSEEKTKFRVMKRLDSTHIRVLIL